MTESTTVRLDQLAQAAGLSQRSVVRWFSAGVVRGINRGRGPGNGIVLSREAAIEALALLVLRRAGVPLQRLRAIARELRMCGKASRDFLGLSADGRTVLLDDAGADALLRDPRTGKPMLGVVLDLRPMRRQVERVVDELAESPV